MPRKKLPSGIYKRGEVYYSCFSANGRQVRKRLSTDLEVSKVMLRKLRLRHEAGEIDNEYPVEELVERYFRQQEHTLAPRSITRYRKALAPIRELLRPRHVADITPDSVVRYRCDRLGEGIRAVTVEYEIGILKQILRWGARQRITANTPPGILGADEVGRGTRGTVSGRRGRSDDRRGQ